MKSKWVWLLVFVFAVAILVGLLIGHNRNQQQFISKFREDAQTQAQAASEEIAALQAEITSLREQVNALTGERDSLLKARRR